MTQRQLPRPPRPETPIDRVDQILGIARRSLSYLWIVILAGVLGGVAGVSFGMLRGRTYESRAVIMYRELIPTRVLQGPGAPSGLGDMANRFREMLLSQPLLERVIDDESLYDELRDERGIAAAVDEMREAIDFKTRGGGTFHVAYRGASPEKARSVTEMLVRLLIERERAAQLEGVQATREFLANERLRVEELLHEKERALATFLADHPEFAVETKAGLAGATGASVRAKNKEKEKLKRDARLRALERQRSRLRARLDGEQVVKDKSAELLQAEQKLQAARREIADARDRLRDLRASYTDRHPDVRSASRRVKRAGRRVELARETLRALSRADERRRRPVTGEERSEIQGELDRLKQAIEDYRRRRSGERLESGSPESAVVELEARWARLYREVDEARERYEKIESKAFTAEIVAASEVAGQGTQLSVLDPPSLPTRPSGIPLRLLALAGMVVFGGLGALLAVGLALADDNILDRRDFERLGLSPPLAVIASAKKRKRRRRG